MIRQVRLPLSAFSAAAVIITSGCAMIDLAAAPRQPSAALAAPAGTRLHDVFAARLGPAPAPSGFVPLERGLDAFVARAALAELAERTLDLQYYIVRGDTSGLLLLGRVFTAAERGMCVWQLLDEARAADSAYVRELADARSIERLRVGDLDGRRGEELRLVAPYFVPGVSGVARSARWSATA